VQGRQRGGADRAEGHPEQLGHRGHPSRTGPPGTEQDDQGGQEHHQGDVDRHRGDQDEVEGPVERHAAVGAVVGQDGRSQAGPVRAGHDGHDEVVPGDDGQEDPGRGHAGGRRAAGARAPLLTRHRWVITGHRAGGGPRRDGERRRASAPGVDAPGLARRPLVDGRELAQERRGGEEPVVAQLEHELVAGDEPGGRSKEGEVSVAASTSSTQGLGGSHWGVEWRRLTGKRPPSGRGGDRSGRARLHGVSCGGARRKSHNCRDFQDGFLSRALAGAKEVAAIDAFRGYASPVTVGLPKDTVVIDWLRAGQGRYRTHEPSTGASLLGDGRRRSRSGWATHPSSWPGLCPQSWPVSPWKVSWLTVASRTGPPGSTGRPFLGCSQPQSRSLAPGEGQCAAHGEPASGTPIDV
jgi:hypothetical protein